MKVWAIALGSLALFLIVGIFLLARWSGFQGGPVSVYVSLFANSGLTIRLPLVLEAFGLVVAVAFSADSILNPKIKIHPALSYTMLVAPPFGLLSTLYELSMVSTAAVATHTTNLLVMGPSIATSLLPLTAGLLVGGVAGLPYVLGRPKKGETAPS